MLTRMVKAVISCFHGPQVEGSFSVMKQIMSTETAQLNVSTYSAIQSIKYPLRAVGKTAVEFFSKVDFLHEFPNPRVVKNLTKAGLEYKEEQKLAREATAKRHKQLQLSCRPLQSKAKQIEIAKLSAKRALRKYKLQKLAELAQARLAKAGKRGRDLSDDTVTNAAKRSKTY